MKKIRVLSFDFDGCLFNALFFDNKESRLNVVKSNSQLLNSLKEKNPQFEKTIVLVGSNRQSMQSDLSNSFGGSIQKGSCFPRIKEVAEHLNAELDSFLLADVYANSPAGTAFKKVCDELNGEVFYENYYPEATDDYDPNESEEAKKERIAAYRKKVDEARKKKRERDNRHADWAFDDTKVTILYAQMHKIATENPNAEIEYDFYDDKLYILDALDVFFNKNRYLIPKNVTLKLHHYGPLGADNKLTADQKTKMVGEGDADYSYCDTVKLMARDDLQEKVMIEQVDVANNLDIVKFNQELKQLKVNEKNKVFKRTAKFSGLMLAGVMIAGVSIAATAVSFGLLTPFSGIGITIGMTLLAKSFSMMAAAIGIGVFAAGVVGTAISSKKASRYDTDMNINLEKTNNEEQAVLAKHSNNASVNSADSMSNVSKTTLAEQERSSTQSSKPVPVAVSEPTANNTDSTDNASKITSAKNMTLGFVERRSTQSSKPVSVPKPTTEANHDGVIVPSAGR